VGKLLSSSANPVEAPLENDLLPDVLLPGLRVVFCGTAAGRVSAELGSYYAHSNNKFWSILAETGLTGRKLKPHEFMEVATFGVGLTDLCKDAAGSDRDIRPKPEHRATLKQKIVDTQPGLLAFTSIEAGKRYFGRAVKLGLQPDLIGSTSIYVLPSTSLMAAWNWEPNKSHWHDLVRLVNFNACRKG
jgi:TDG/mug DNA glycosylase family protein